MSAPDDPPDEGPDAAVEGAEAAASAEPIAPIEKEPDYRFTLANERTFLAWIRTSLGLVAGGVVVHQLVESVDLRAVRMLIAATAVVLAVVLAVGAFVHWRSVQLAMRRNQDLPGNLLIPVLTAGTVLIAVIATGLVVLL